MTYFSSLVLVVLFFMAAACQTVVAEVNGGLSDQADVEKKYQKLSIFGNKATLEIAPLLYAVEHFYPAGTIVELGGIARLYDMPGIPGFKSSGRADVATHAETQALKYSLTHPDLRIILTIAEGHYRIVGRKSAGITSLEDLRGKKIGTIPGTSSAYFLHDMLAKAGLNEADVKIMRIWPLSDMPQALSGGEVDAITIWEPAMQKVVNAIGDDAIIFSDKNAYREIFNLNTTAEILKNPQKRGELIKLVRSIIQATYAIRHDTEEAQRLIVRASGHSREVVSQSWPHQTYPGTIVPDLLDVMVEEEKWLAAKAKREPRGRQELARMIDFSVLEAAIKLP